MANTTRRRKEYLPYYSAYLAASYECSPTELQHLKRKLVESYLRKKFKFRTRENAADWTKERRALSQALSRWLEADKASEEEQPGARTDRD